VTNGLSALLNLVVIGALVMLATVGLGVGKWVHKGGGAVMTDYVCCRIVIDPKLTWAEDFSDGMPAMRS
jgi:hypothetical protein